MGGQESVQASGRVQCEGGVYVWDGKSIRQVVDVKKDVTYTNLDLSSLTTMMTRDISSAADHLDTALGGVVEMALCDNAGGGEKSIEYK